MIRLLKWSQKLLPKCNNILPKIAILTFLVSLFAVTTLYLTFDFFLEKDLKKTQQKKIEDEFYRLSNYIKKQEDQLLLLAHTAFSDHKTRCAFNHINERQHFNKWARKYTTLNSKLHDLDSLTIWSEDDGLLASTNHIIGNMTVNLSNYSITRAKTPQSGIIKLGDELWIISIAPILYENFRIGSIQFSRNISNKFKNEVSIESNLQLTTLNAPKDTNYTDGRLVLANTIDGRQIYIKTNDIDRNEIEQDNTRMYTIIMILLVTTVLFIIFVMIVKKETLPFKTLETLFKQVDEVKFGHPIVPSNPCTEAQMIYKAYNDMLVKLQYIKEKEIMFNQKSKLISIGNLAARVSHDINNPLSVIRSISDIGRRQGYTSNDTYVENMNKIYEQTNRCMDISHNLLNISKKISTKLHSISLKNFMQEYLTDKSENDPQFDYTLTDQSEDTLVKVNPQICAHILDILIKNALEANQNQTIQFRLFKTFSWAVIEITDNGVGFPVSSQDEIFDLFFTTKAHGNGVGLSNALSLAHAMEGTIRVTDAAKGQISIFTQLESTSQASDTQKEALPEQTLEHSDQSTQQPQDDKN